MESNAENDERREERYRRKSEHDRLRRDRETDEKSMQGLQLNVNVILLNFVKEFHIDWLGIESTIEPEMLL